MFSLVEVQCEGRVRAVRWPAGPGRGEGWRCGGPSETTASVGAVRSPRRIPRSYSRTSTAVE